MTTQFEEIGTFLAKAEEKTISEFMVIAGLGKEYQSANSIPKIKSVLKKFAEQGYSIKHRKISNKMNEPMIWRISLLLDDNEIIRQDIKITFNTIKV